MNRLLPLFGLAIALAVSGCASKPSLEGVWVSDLPSTVQTGTKTLTLKADKSFTSVSLLNYPNAVLLTATEQGTWKLEDQKLHLDIRDVDWVFSGSDTVAVARSQTVFRTMKEEILKEARSTPAKNLTWTGDDSFTLTSDNEPTETYRRKK